MSGSRPKQGSSEFALIAAIEKMAASETARVGASRAAAKKIPLGIGDDAAVLRFGSDALVSTDACVAGVHFEHDWLSPAALGRRAFRCAISDIAAMGGTATAFVVALAVPRDYKSALTLMRGAVKDAVDAGVFLAGGNLTRASQLSITCTVFGEAPIKLPARSNARVGHAVFVTGRLGGCAAGVDRLRAGERKGSLVNAYRTPPLRLHAGRRFTGVAGLGAMIDVSDGLVQDLGHICAASSTQARIDTAALPLAPALRKLGTKGHDYALYGGEDYELLLTAPSSAQAALERAASAAGCALTRIGDMVARRGPADVVDLSGHKLTGGFTHF